MNINKNIISFCIIFLALVLYNTVCANDDVNPKISKLAARITKECSTDYEKAMAIYKWECKHIAYDVTLKIYDADECLKKKKGVCQAYSELFVMLAKECGLKAKMIVGEAKSDPKSTGLKLKNNGHAWVKVKTEKGWILVDPTWGAGYVDKKKFTHTENDMSWFDVDPHWMIFTHFPSNVKNQMLDTPLTEKQYKTLPDMKPFLGRNGLDAAEMLDFLKDNDSVSFPKMYYCPLADSTLKILEIPWTDTLVAGEAYEFQFANYDLFSYPTLFFKRKEIDRDHWTVKDNIYTIKYRPKEAGNVRIYMTKRINKIRKVKKKHMYISKRTYYTFIEYPIKKKSEAK